MTSPRMPVGENFPYVFKAGRKTGGPLARPDLPAVGARSAPPPPPRAPPGPRRARRLARREPAAGRASTAGHD